MSSYFNQVQYLQISLELAPMEHLSGSPPRPANIRPGWKDMQWNNDPAYSAFSARIFQHNLTFVCKAGLYSSGAPFWFPTKTHKY
jgi:hypothetical protein